MLHIDIEDSLGASPGIGIDINLGGVNLPSNEDLVALANDVLNSDVIQHIDWGGVPYLYGVSVDSSTQLYFSPTPPTP